MARQRAAQAGQWRWRRLADQAARRILQREAREPGAAAGEAFTRDTQDPKVAEAARPAESGGAEHAAGAAMALRSSNSRPRSRLRMQSETRNRAAGSERRTGKAGIRTAARRSSATVAKICRISSNKLSKQTKKLRDNPNARSPTGSTATQVGAAESGGQDAAAPGSRTRRQALRIPSAANGTRELRIQFAQNNTVRLRCRLRQMTSSEEIPGITLLGANRKRPNHLARLEKQLNQAASAANNTQERSLQQA